MPSGVHVWSPEGTLEKSILILCPQTMGTPSVCGTNEPVMSVTPFNSDRGIC